MTLVKVDGKAGRLARSKAVMIGVPAGLMAAVLSVVTGATAFAVSTGPSAVVGGATGSLSGDLLNIATEVLPYAAGIAAIMIGWRLTRKALKF